MKTNTKPRREVPLTHEGARAFAHMTPMQALRRAVLSCMLFEAEFYEDGVAVADRIRELALALPPADVAALAIQARNQFKLRHAPLWLLVALAKSGSGTPVLGNSIPHVIKRADEIAEFVSLYWKANPPTKPKIGQTQKQRDLSAQMKLGLAEAFKNFNAYQLAKYDRAGAVRLRDVAFMCHVAMRDIGHGRTLAKLLNTSTFPDATKSSGFNVAALMDPTDTPGLESPDTWEVALSAGGSKKDEFERLIREGKLGYLALLRNLRNMIDADCDETLVREAITGRKGGAEWVLPFRFIAAARAAPHFERELDAALIASIDVMAKLPGKTAVMVDVSRSMNDKLSAKSDLTRVDAACALAAMFPSDDLRMFSFSDDVVEVPPRRGMAGVDALQRSQPHSGTALFDAVSKVNGVVNYDRLVVITDEQAEQGSRLFTMGRVQGTLKTLPDPKARGYMINVASAKNGVGYGKWTHIDGFSEAVFSFIREIENTNLV